MQLTTVRVLLEQEPSRLFLVLGANVGTPPSSCFRVSASFTRLSLFVSPSTPSLRWGLRFVVSGYTRYRRLTVASPLRARLGDGSETGPSRRHTPPAPALWGSLPRLRTLLNRRYPHWPYTKKGRCFHLPFRVQTMSSNHPLRFPTSFDSTLSQLR